MVLRGGSCMLQEPHGEYQHQLRACVFKLKRSESIGQAELGQL